MRPQSRWIMRMVAGLCVSMLFVTTQIPAAQAMDLPDTSSGSSFLSLLSKFFSNNKTEEPEHASEENTELTERKLTGKTPDIPMCGSSVTSTSKRVPMPR